VQVAANAKLLLNPPGLNLDGSPKISGFALDFFNSGEGQKLDIGMEEAPAQAIL